MYANPEKTLLRKVAEKQPVPVKELNDRALREAIADGYVSRLGDHIFLTPDGNTRLENLD